MPRKSKAKTRKSKDPCADLKRMLKERDAELREAREQQAAVSDILRVMSGARSHVMPVLQVVAKHAMRLCRSRDARVWLVEGDRSKYVAGCGDIAPVNEGDTMPITRGSSQGRAMLDRKPVHISDAATVSPDEFPVVRKMQRLHGHRTVLAVPLMREKHVLGAIVLRKMVVEPYTKRQIEFVRTFADQAAIAIENVRLYEEVRARNAELSEALEQQTATSEILNVISHSALDVTPVFQAVAEKAVELCGADNASILQREGDLYRYVANAGNFADQDTFMSFWGTITLRPGRGSLTGRVALERRSVQIEDVDTDPEYEREYAAHKVSGSKAHLGVPLLKDGEPIGLIIARRFAPRLFTEKQTKVLETFAAQAVIAIENVRLFKELQARNAEITEALEQQTATSEILRVISSSPTDTQPVFDAIVKSGVHLFGGMNVALRLVKGQRIETVASTLPADATFPNPVDDDSYPGSRAILRREVLQIPDIFAEEWINPGAKQRGEQVGFRAILVVPMLREDTAVGVIIVSRPTPGPFADKHVTLLKTFADQAVIAIENVRLFKELEERNKDLAETLEQQTATSEILRIISSSPTDTQPVFDAIVKAGVRLFGGMIVSLRLIKGDNTEVVASTLAGGNERFPIPLSDDQSPSIRSILRREVIQIPDVLAEEWVSEESKQRARRRGYRAVVRAPMMREGNAIGVIAVSRAMPGPFADKQIALLQTFADQAVIAIENVRLFKELQTKNADLTEALEQQTATAEILQVISSSPTDVTPVLEAVTHRAAQLCGAQDARLFLLEGNVLRNVAGFGEFEGTFAARPLTAGHPMGRAVTDLSVVHIEDLAAALDEFPESRETQQHFGHRTTLAVPLARENRALGAILIRRKEVRPFSQKQIDLVRTFADQAVIAIENVRLFNETKEALEQQTATADILRVISSSPTDVQPVFDAIAESAARLCSASDVLIRRVDGDALRLVRHMGSIPVVADTLAITRGTVPGCAVLERRTIHVHDTQEAHARGEYPEGTPLQRGAGDRTFLAVPLVRDDVALGVIAIRRQEVRPFSDKQIKLLETFADQAVIAIENVRLFNETKEALEQQTVISEILRVISSSPTDTQPVFDAIVKSGVHLFGGMDVSLRLIKGDHTETVASTLTHDTGDVVALDDDSRPSPRAILRREVVQIPDYLAAEEWVSAKFKQRAQQRGFRALLVAPMLRENNVIGTIGVFRATPGAFTEKQVALLKTFADQAVIAIENVRLFKELQTRNAEITEALEQQTATAEILKVISSSPTDVQPVFNAIVHSGVHLFRGLNVSVLLVKEGQVDLAASTLPQPVGGLYPFPLEDNGMVSCRAILRRELVQVPDVAAEDWISGRMKQLGESRGFKAVIAAPLLRENKAIGSIAVTRATAGPFSEKEVALLRTFADQAVIAIENVRLFKEINEALERQTATANVLKLISRTTFELQPVLDTLVRSACELCDAQHAVYFRSDPDGLRPEAWHNVGDEYIAYRKANPIPISDQHATGRAALTREVVHVYDVLADPNYGGAAAQRLGEMRSVVGVPVLREGELLGVMGIFRKEVRPFSEKQIDLVKTFADQAVIAIENVRLFKELQARNAELTEALEQQTATAEILRVISSSPTDIQPVLNAVAESAARLCGASDVIIRRADGDVLRAVAHLGSMPVAADAVAITRGTVSGCAVLERRTIHHHDILEAYARGEYPEGPSLQRGTPYRTMLVAPLLREDTAIGTIVIRRLEVRPFSDKQIKLLETFADQAVIAIENVRLFKELQARNAEVTEALEQQTATAEILRIISTTPTDVTPVLDAVARRAAQLCESRDVRIHIVEGDVLRYVTGFGDVPRTEGPRSLTRGRVSGRAVIDRTVMHIEDVTALPEEEYPEAREAQRHLGHRTMLAVPLLREDKAFGVIVMRRKEVRPFAPKQIELVKTFADQAVIAIENVRLFKEINEALERQTATSEVLKVISRSTFDLDPVLESLAENARKLCDADSARISRPNKDGNYVVVIESALEPRPEHLARMRSHPLRPDRGSAVGRAVLDRRPVHIPDVLADPEYTRLDIAESGGYRTVLAVPMLRAGEPIGVIILTRTKEVRPFTDKQVEVVTTFADQAVIAIENVRLFHEIQDKSRQLEIANKHKSDFLANMSHELRTPLNAIIGFSEMLLARMFGETNAKQEEFLRDIHSSGEHLLSLINDILDLSKIEAGRMELNLKVIDPAETLENTVMLVKERAARRGITVKLEVDEALDKWVADERKIRQIMLNLLSNALKFTPEGGQISVKAAREGSNMAVAVSDTGIGIKPEDQALIFEEFQQAGSDYTKKAEGTGLGLALTRKFVELHGGTIRVESAEGKGSTFTFTLPQMQA